MGQVITIHDVPRDILLAELRHVVAYLGALGHEACEVCFGWRWGMDHPPEDPWGAIAMPLAGVEAEVGKVEAAGLGELGRDDVTIRVAGLDGEFLFCHHWGIHLTDEGTGGMAGDFLARWEAAGLTPTEGDGTPGPG